MHAAFPFLRTAVGLVVVSVFAPAVVLGASPAAPPRLHEAARPRPPIPGAPKAADVCMPTWSEVEVVALHPTRLPLPIT